MSGKSGCFHSNHGQNIRLKEGGTEAHRVESYNKAVVFTEQPIPPGAMFTVKLLDKGGGWAGSIVSLCVWGVLVYAPPIHTVSRGSIGSLIPLVVDSVTVYMLQCIWRDYVTTFTLHTLTEVWLHLTQP